MIVFSEKHTVYEYCNKTNFDVLLGNKHDRVLFRDVMMIYGVTSLLCGVEFINTAFNVTKEQ